MRRSRGGTLTRAEAIDEMESAIDCAHEEFCGSDECGCDTLAERIVAALDEGTADA
jgi:hypothetical protein